MAQTNRRRFLEALAWSLSAIVAALVGAPLVVAFFDPARRTTVRRTSGPGDYGKLDDLPIGMPRKLDVVSATTDAWDRSDPKPIGAIWLVRRDVGRVDAYTAACPHLGCPVDFRPDQQVFSCPCHVSAFALADGARLVGPSPRSLDPLPVEVRDGRVLVTYKNFVEGIASRRES